jgi:hypothetical protein
MICHSQLYTQAQMLEPGRASLVEKSADHWQRVNVLPDYVYFDHSIHVDKILQRAANCGRQRVAVVVQAARSLNSMADGPGSSSRSVWRISAGAEPGAVRGTIVPKSTVRSWPGSSARLVRNAHMAKAPNFKLALTSTGKPTAGPGVGLTTLAGAARLLALLRSWRQARPHWDD